MDVTPHELRTIELREAWRGYRQDDVDELFDRVAGTIERLQAQVERLTERVAKAEDEAGMGREADEMLRRTLLLAQRTADAAVSEAQERARRVVSESEAQAHSIVSGAEEEARRVAIAERQRLEDEVREMSRRRDLLLSDIEALEETTRDHRRRLREFMEAELARLESRPVPVPPSRPELHDVPVPEPVDADQVDADQVDAGDVVEAVGADVVAEADAVPDDVDVSAAEAFVTDDPGNEPVEPVEPVGPVEQVDASAGLAPVEPAEQPAHESFDDAFAELDGGMADLLPRRRRRHRRPEGDDPDDEFFSELRAAVTDETPLGPIDDDPDDRVSSVDSVDSADLADADHGGFDDVVAGDGPSERAGEFDEFSGPVSADASSDDSGDPRHGYGGADIDLDGFGESVVDVPAETALPEGAQFFDQDAVSGSERGERDEFDDAEWDTFDDGIPDDGRLRSVFRRRG